MTRAAHWVALTAAVVCVMPYLLAAVGELLYGPAVGGPLFALPLAFGALLMDKPFELDELCALIETRLKRVN